MTESPHLTPRQKAREIAFQFIYRFDREPLHSLNETAIDAEFEKHSEHFGNFDHSREFALRLIKATLQNITGLDSLIESTAQNWKIERIGAIEKAFLRIGAAELLYFKEVPASVTLNEIIELSKAFGESDTPLFLNGILDPISKTPEALSGKIASNS